MSSQPPASHEGPSSAPSARCRYRIRFGKDGPLRYTSHLDLARTWERLLRRAGLPLAYSQGFNPQPKIQLAAALPLGYASSAEVLDMWLEGDVPDSGVVLARLREVAPEGLSIESVEEVDLQGPALQTLTIKAVYRIVVGDAVDRGSLERRVEALLAQDKIWRERREKRYDLRPLIDALDVVQGDPLALHAVLALSQEGGTGRPDEVVAALGLDATALRITRTAILFEE
jgi:radical SAM-linked protein